jgi:hypothetical protein
MGVDVQPHHECLRIAVDEDKGREREVGIEGDIMKWKRNKRSERRKAGNKEKNKTKKRREKE